MSLKATLLSLRARACRGRSNLIRLLRRFSLLAMTFMVLATAAMDPDSEQRVISIASQLRCPVCRGIAIAESPSELAQDMMKIIREQVTSGKTEEEIKNYFVDRYGEWILLQPKPKGIHLSLWIIPAIALLGGGIFIALLVKKWVRRKND